MDCGDQTTVDLDSGLECINPGVLLDGSRTLPTGRWFRRENTSQPTENCMLERVRCQTTLSARLSEWEPGDGIAGASSIPIVLYCRAEDDFNAQ